MADENHEKSNKSLVIFLLNGDNYLNWAEPSNWHLEGNLSMSTFLAKLRQMMRGEGKG
jgi:hypothetical protein